MRGRPVALFASVFALVVIADQASKSAIASSMDPSGPSIEIIGTLLRFTYVRNTGAAFGILPGRGPVFMIVSSLVIVGIAVYLWRVRPRRTLVVGALALVAGGAVGNLIDRISSGRVTDFIEVPYWPVFNLADSAVLVGAALLVWWILFGPAEHTSATVERSAVEPSSGDVDTSGAPGSEKTEDPASPS